METNEFNSVSGYREFRAEVEKAYVAGQLDLDAMLDALALATTLLATADTLNFIEAKMQQGLSIEEVVNDLRANVLASVAALPGDL